MALRAARRARGGGGVVAALTQACRPCEETVLRLRAAGAPVNLGKAVGERRSCEHFVDSRLPRGVDDVNLHVRGEAHGWNGRERRLALHRGERAEADRCAGC